MKFNKITRFILIAISTFALASCEDSLERADYITFGNANYDGLLVDIGGSTTVDAIVYTSTEAGSNRTFDLIVDGANAPAGSYSVPATVTVPAGSNEGVVTVTLSDVDLGIGTSRLGISIKSDGSYFVGQATTISYAQKCTEVIATLNIVFDGYGSETTWDVKDALGGIVASGSGYADGQATASEQITLCQGRSYTFTIYDAYADGLSYPTDGTYTLTLGGEVVASGSGDFGASESTDFDS